MKPLRKSYACLQANTTTSSKKGKAKEIDTSVVKLRAKYKWLKEQWRKYTDRAKSGSGRSAIDEPEWFNIMNPILSETHTELKVATKAADIESDGTCSSEDDEYSDNYEEDKTEVTMAKSSSYIGMKISLVGGFPLSSVWVPSQKVGSLY